MIVEKICENLNFYTHIHLSNLRTPPGKPRKYPTGLGFGTAVCANYWFETLGVLALLIMTMFDIGSKSTVPVFIIERGTGLTTAYSTRVQ